MDQIMKFKDFLGVMIFRDNDVLEPFKYCIGNGQGCNTFWFASLDDARQFIKKFRDRIKTTDTGGVNGLIPSGLCKKCQCHYSFGTPKYKKYPDFACRVFKEKLKAEAGCEAITVKPDEPKL